MEHPSPIIPDSWQSLKQFTNARIALGSTGVAVPLKELLQFRLAHAHARDAVYALLNEQEIIRGLEQLQLSFSLLHSKAQHRDAYLQRPDLGRQLHEASAAQLKNSNDSCDIAILIADGLSATAVNEHALPLLQCLIPMLLQAGFVLAPINLVQQARVAIADEVGVLLHAKCTVVLIGERPGLSSPDSMGAYLTYAPAIGATDECRNCISNIRPAGMDVVTAANKVFYLIQEAFRLQYSGVALKDNAQNTALPE
ncbi:ethanolamine ammonia-lyase subunit EutC [Ferruginibacter sp.]